MMSIVRTIAIVDSEICTLSYLLKSLEKISGKSICRRLCTNCVTRTATESQTYPWLRLDRMRSGNLSRKIYIASLLYFMLGKYNLSTGKGRRNPSIWLSTFSGFLFIDLFLFIFTPVMSCYPKLNNTEKKKNIQVAIDHLSDNKTRLTLYFVR